MSEIGIANSIVRCIDFGAKLALGLYELAAKIQSAPSEISHLGRDITVFCSVLRQIEALLKDKTSCCLSADALSVLSGITIRCQDCLEDLQQIADSVDLEASLHKPLKSERKDDVRIAALTSAAHSPAISPNEKGRAWRPTGKSGSTSSSAEHGANLAERIKWIISRPKSGLVRQELDTIFTFLQLMVAIIESAHRMKKGSDPTCEVRDNADLIAESLLLAYEASLIDLEAAEAMFEQSTLAPLRRPKSPALKRRKDASVQRPEEGAKLSLHQTSDFLREATSCQMQDLSVPLILSVSRASVKSSLLAAKWIISTRYLRNRIAESVRRVEANETSMSRCLHTWNELSSQLARSSSESILHLKASAEKEKQDPLVSQLCSQINHLSNTCGNLTRALHNLEAAHEAVKTDYEKFLKSNVQNQEALLELLQKEEEQVLALQQKLNTRIPDRDEKTEQLAAELNETRAARDQLTKELDDLRPELCTRLEDVVRLTNLVEEQDMNGGNLAKEMSKLRDQLRQKEELEELLRQRIASEKAQRLKAIQLLSGRLSGEPVPVQRQSSNNKSQPVN